MGYTEVRLQREIQQLRKEVRETRTQEKQTRQGCLELLHAMQAFVTSLEGADLPARARFAELVTLAEARLTPVPDVV